MAGEGPGHRLVHQRVQETEHHRISRIGTQQRRIGIAMDLAIERLRHIGIGGQPLGDRTGPEVQAAPGGMGPAVQERHRRHIELVRHHERHGLPRLEGHFNRLPWRIARGHDVDGVRHGVVHLHHQFTEAVVHPITDRLDRANVRDRTAPDRLPGLRIMIGRSNRLGDEGPEPAMRPRGRTECVIVPEHGSHVRIDPEPLPDELHRHDVVRRVLVLQPLGQGNRTALDLLDPSNFVALDVIGADQDQRADVVLACILHLERGPANFRR